MHLTSTLLVQEDDQKRAAVSEIDFEAASRCDDVKTSTSRRNSMAYATSRNKKVRVLRLAT
jgi:hypothetical protein